MGELNERGEMETEQQNRNALDMFCIIKLRLKLDPKLKNKC